MATQTSTLLKANPREPAGSRSARRLRREGAVPGVLYGGGEDPVSFSVDARELRHALADAGAVIELRIGDAEGTPAVVKELVRHPVNGETVHLDLLRVRLDRPIQAPVLIELIGTEDAAGVRLGGVLEQPLREVTVEALPNSIPDSIQHDITAMEIGDTLTLAQLTAPSGVTLIDDGDTLVATLSAPRLQAEAETEIETETAVVGEGEGDAQGEAAGESAGDGDAESSGDSAE
jgi:large subunit ribosomal protein L25